MSLSLWQPALLQQLSYLQALRVVGHTATITRAMVLGDVISRSRGSATVPLGGSFDVCWEIVLLSLGYREWEVSVEDYCDFFGVSHGVLL